MQKFTKRITSGITVLSVIVFCAFNFSVYAQINKSNQKISSDLLELVPGKLKSYVPGRLKSQVINSTVKTQKTPEALSLVPYNDYIRIKNGKVLIQVIAENNGDALADNLKKLGFIKSGVYERKITGYISVDSILSLNAVKELKYAAPAYKPMNNSGIALTNGDIALKSDVVRNSLGIDGSGSKIGILSDSYNSLNGASLGIESGDLPGAANPYGYNSEIEVLEDITDGTDEGRGMMEIVHDIAPGAELAFHTAFNGDASFAEGILKLAEAGCNIISDDVTYFNEPFFQDGIIAQAVDKAVKKYHVSYFSSAGNYARESYQSKFRNSGDTTLVINPYGGYILGEYILHDFDPGEGVDNFQKVTFGPGDLLLYAFQWDEPFASASPSSPGSASDLDIFLTLEENAQTVILESINANEGLDPYEVLGVVNNGTDSLSAYIAVGKWLGVSGDNPDPNMIKYVNFGENLIDEYHTKSATCFGHSNSAKVQSVGASAWFFTPEYGVDPPEINYFSSVGGTPILMRPNGKRLRRPEIRKNPDFVATDGGNTTFFGQQINDGDNFPNFFGTSASAPHAAGVMALLNEISNNKVRTSFLENCLAFTAIDMDDPFTPYFDKHYDFATGYGLIQADKAADLLIKFTMEPLSVAATCSEDPEETRNWVISNPNNYNVELNWEIYGSEQEGSITVEPGETTITTEAVSYFNLMVISWNVSRCNSFDAAYSRGEVCSRSTKSAITADTYDKNLQVVTQVYPNPVISDININIYTEQSEKVYVNIYQSNGTVVINENYKTKEGLNTIQLNLDDLQEGVYMIKIYNNSDQILDSRTFIKQ